MSFDNIFCMAGVLMFSFMTISFLFDRLVLDKNFRSGSSNRKKLTHFVELLIYCRNQADMYCHVILLEVS